MHWLLEEKTSCAICVAQSLTTDQLLDETLNESGLWTEGIRYTFFLNSE